MSTHSTRSTHTTGSHQGPRKVGAAGKGGKGGRGHASAAFLAAGRANFAKGRAKGRTVAKHHAVSTKAVARTARIATKKATQHPARVKRKG